MHKPFPKYLVDLDIGTVTDICILFDEDHFNEFYNNIKQLDYLAEVTLKVGYMTAKVLTETKYNIGDKIDLKKTSLYSVSVSNPLQFQDLQPLLEQFVSFELKEQYDNIDQNGHHSFSILKVNFPSDLPVIIKTYLKDILNLMRWCAVVTFENQEPKFIQSFDHFLAEQHVYELALLHAQLHIEIYKGDSINIGEPQHRRRVEGRKKSINTRKQRKSDSIKEIQELINSNLKLQNLVTHNYSKAALLIKELSSSQILPSAETIAESYLPQMFPRKK